MNNYDVIIIGGSFAGLSAALILGRSLKATLVIDSKAPCFLSSARTHGWITHDGSNPLLMLELAYTDFRTYNTVSFLTDVVTDIEQSSDRFLVTTKTGERITAKKIIIATGVKELFPPIGGLKDCWGISVLHCPYCQAFEVKNKIIGIIGNGDYGFDRLKLLSGWTGNLLLFTNGPTTLSVAQAQIIKSRNILIIEGKVNRITHVDGIVSKVILENSYEYPVDVLFIKTNFKHPGELPLKLGCQLNEAGYVIADETGKTNIPGVYAAGDCTTSFRTVATSAAGGLRAGIAVNNELMTEGFS